MCSAGFVHKVGELTYISTYNILILVIVNDFIIQLILPILPIQNMSEAISALKNSQKGFEYAYV